MVENVNSNSECISFIGWYLIRSIYLIETPDLSLWIQFISTTFVFFLEFKVQINEKYSVTISCGKKSVMIRP